MMKRVLITSQRIAEEAMQQLRDENCEILTLPRTTTADELAAFLAKEPVDAIVSRTVAINAKAIENAKLLKVISRHGVGVDNIDVEAATRRGIPVLVARGANSRSVAEHTLTLMFALARHLIPLNDNLRDGGWEQTAYVGIELAGKRLALVGLGVIGAHVAKMAQALGMTVAAFDPYAPPQAFEAPIQRKTVLADMLPEADFISIHCPLTDATRDLIGHAEFAKMKPTAYLINTARGPVVNEEALLDALRNGGIAGAGLDSFTAEPLPADHPLRTLPNVIRTPHIGAATIDAGLLVAKRAVSNVLAVLYGQDIAPGDVANPSVFKNPARTNS